jgi:hypothetical protein
MARETLNCKETVIFAAAQAWGEIFRKKTAAMHIKIFCFSKILTGTIFKSTIIPANLILNF